MGIELTFFTTIGSAAGHGSSPDDTHSRRIQDMKASLVDMFGDAALAIARGQPNERDVGGESGVRWRDLVDSFQQA